MIGRLVGRRNAPASVVGLAFEQGADPVVQARHRGAGVGENHHALGIEIHVERGRRRERRGLGRGQLLGQRAHAGTRRGVGDAAVLARERERPERVGRVVAAGVAHRAADVGHGLGPPAVPRAVERLGDRAVGVGARPRRPPGRATPPCARGGPRSPRSRSVAAGCRRRRPPPDGPRRRRAGGRRRRPCAGCPASMTAASKRRSAVGKAAIHAAARATALSARARSVVPGRQSGASSIGHRGGPAATASVTRGALCSSPAGAAITTARSMSATRLGIVWRACDRATAPLYARPARVVNRTAFVRADRPSSPVASTPSVLRACRR